MKADDARADLVASQPTAPDVLDTQAAGGKAIRGSALRSGGYGLSLVISLIAVPFMIRHLGAVDYGYYITVSAIVFIIGGITEAGLTNLGIREVSVLEGRAREHFLRNLVGLRFTLTAIGIGIGVAITWATGAEAAIVSGTAIVGLGLLLTLVQQTYMIPLNVQLRLGWVTVLDLLKHATLSGFFIAFVIVGAGLAAFFWANVLAGALAVILTLLLVRRHAPLRPAFELRTWIRVLRDVLPYAVAAAVGLIYFRIAVVLLSYVSTGEETGLYSVAFRIVEVLGLIPWLLVSSAFPILARAARDDEERLGYALQRIFEMSLIIGTGIALTLGVAAPFAIAVIAGEGFEGSVHVLRLLAVALITTFLVATWLFALLSLKRYRQVLYANLLAAVVAIGGTLALASPLGAEGAALATVAAEASLVAASLYFIRRARPGWALKLGVVPKVALATVAALAVALTLSHWPSEVLAVLAALVFGAVVLATRAIPPELFAALARRDPEIAVADGES